MNHPDKSEVWKDEGDSGRKDEIFSDAHFGLMPKTVLIKASAFRLLDHVTSQWEKHSLPSAPDLQSCLTLWDMGLAAVFITS